jgi:glycosyltransferase involved in cell wall biosynthesis
VTVDVLLPYYGDVAMMKQAVESVLRQNNPDWTLTIVDDGYPDESLPGYFAGLAASDTRITYVRNEQNLGANGNYRKAVGFVRNELAVVMGADDVMLPNYLDCVLRAHERFPQAQIIQPGVEVIDENGVVGRPGLVDRIKGVLSPRGTGTRLLAGEALAVSLMRGNWLYFPSIAWQSEALVRTNFREGLNVVQDLALALDLIKAGGAMAVDDEICFQYRRHRQSDSSWRALEGTRFIEERGFFEAMADEFEAIGWRRAARTARLHLTSRLNAATLLPKAYQSKQTEGVKNLREHVLSRPGRSAKP